VGKHSNPSEPAGTPGNITDDTWTKILNAAVSQPNGETWARNAWANAENARNN
jgi:hypothetical protein